MDEEGEILLHVLPCYFLLCLRGGFSYISVSNLISTTVLERIDVSVLCQLKFKCTFAVFPLAL